jgi:DNA polymerase-3 subunit epsilon
VTYDQTHWIPVRRRQPLPTFYYHEHFVEMLDFVAAHYAHALLDAHVQYLEDFRRLPREAQCLYVRLVNRKGRVFTAKRLCYPELGAPRPILATLAEQGWVGPPQARHFADVLGSLTKSDIYRVLLPRFAGLGRALKKDQLLAFAQDNMGADEFLSCLAGDRVLVQRRIDETSFLLFLYFGRIKDGLSQFTMRDLGIVRTQGFTDSYEPRFSDRAEALEQYYFALRLKRLQKATHATIDQLIAELPEWPVTNFPGSASLRDELALELGRRAEKDGNVAAALELFLAGESASCGERLIRLLLTCGRREDARTHLERCLDDPRSDEEWLVARDLYQRKFEKKRTSTLTDMLRAAETVEIDVSKSGFPERAVVEYFMDQGQQAFRTENLLWRTLFGLLFWDELFVDGDNSLHSPFEFLPGSLAGGNFYADNRERIEAKLALLEDKPAVKRAILRSSTRHYGTPNGIFRWRRSLNDALFVLLDQADPAALAVMLRRLAGDYANSRYGYPDLMLLDQDGIRFFEVKTEGDQLRRNQLLRLRQLREAGFRADVLRVRWVIDPAQEYVVVDVETTGGRGEHHRVTEIGAVKVRDGRIVERFQTLLNPQRTIPPNITRLTGITPAMVSDAPYFSDIADDFETFLDGAIFVAHNVEFDYGFIAREFERIGRPLRMPKLCTCASMRKLYPGHRSYSLAALCRAFDIPLRQHHRALCDAEAAAELLLLVNEKRQSG